MKTEPLAIVGLGCLFPKAGGPGAFWANIKHAVDGIGDVPPTHWTAADYFDPDPKAADKTYARRGGFLTPVDFNPLEFGIAPRDLEATDTTQLLALVAAKQALTDAGVRFADDKTPAGDGPQVIERSRVSVILGVTGTLELVIPLGARLGHPKWKRAMADAGIAADVADDACARIADSYVPWQENSFPGLLGNVVAGRIASRLDLHGTNCVVDAACASSLSALHLAAMELHAGKADVVVTGGADTFNDIFMFMCFSKTPALSPTGDSRPFDAAGDGTIIGEGLGMVVLKRLTDAERDGDTVYAVLKGIGTSSDGKGTAIYAPNAAGQIRCLIDAYQTAGVDPATVELVEAHGTGTKVGDGVEASALAEVFGASDRADRPWCAVGSVKSQVGHTKAAAGAAGLIKAAMALHAKVLPPTMKVTQPVEPLMRDGTPFYVNTAMRPWLPNADHPRRAGVSAFGFGGSNFHAVLEEHTPAKAAPDWDGRVELLAVSGATPADLARQLEPLGAAPAWDAFARAADISRQTFDPAAACRLVLAAHCQATDLGRLLAGARAKLDDPAEAWQTPDGAYFGRGPVPGGVAVLFPGQGSQAVGMLREVACLFPEMLDGLAAFGPAVAATIYPPTDFRPDARARQDTALRATDAAQPALGAVSHGLWRVLSERFGVTADAFAGHSYGELTALAAADRVSVADFVALSKLRGHLMAEAAAADAGGMLAVFAAPDAVRERFTAAGLKVVVANHNAPTQTVVSGTAEEIIRAEAAFTAAGIRTARLPVAAAFHSPLVAEAAGPFRAALDEVEFHPGTRPVYANTTAGEYPADPDGVRDLLGFQLARPVAFVDEVAALYERGVRTFLEVGPGGVLGRLAEATLTEGKPQGGSDAVMISVDASGGKRSGVLDLGQALARLAARGHVVRLAAWETGSRCRPAPAIKPGHTVPVGGANVVAARPARPPRPPAEVPSSGPSPRMPAPTPPPDDARLRHAVDLTQQTLAALKGLQDQTAQLHKQFLDSQAQAQATLAQLVAGQHALFFPGTPAGPVPTAAAPAIVVPSVVQVAADPPATVPVVALPAVERVVPPTARTPEADTSHSPVVPATTATLPSKADAIEAILLGVVAEKTGYPVDMLDPGMALDADLGVDSIKRVEILSALQEKLPDAPAVRPEHLGTLHTLRDIVAFLTPGAGRELPTTVAYDPAPAHANGHAAVGLNGHGPAVGFDLPPPRPSDSSSLVPLGDPAAVSLHGTADIEAILLGVVAEKTGYPVDMLDPGMALDADLGVDSIKRVEILSALQEKLPDAPAVRPEHLGTLHTLRDIVAFLTPGAGSPNTVKVDVKAVRTPPKTEHLDADRKGPARRPVPPLDPSVSALLAPRTEQLMAIFPVPPARTARPDAVDRVDRSILQAVDLDLASGRPRLPLPEGGEVWLVGPTGDGLAAEIAAQLTAAGHPTKSFPWADPDAAKPSGSPVGLVLVAPVAAGGLPLNKLAFRWVQACGPKLRLAARQGPATLIATVARLDGAFGLGDLDAATDPTAGGLAGLVKTARHEWPDLAYKAIDVGHTFAADDPAAAAAAVVDELLLNAPTEVGIARDHRCTLEIARAVRRPLAGGPLLSSKDVILVSGGARGVTAEVAVALAEASGGTLILTGRTPPPAGAEPDWSRGLSDEAELKKAIADHLGAAATPKAVGEAYAKTLAQREVAQTLDRIDRAGGRAAYFAVNVSNGRQMADLIHQVKVRFGPVTALVHGAGVLADRRLEDLSTDQFDAVYTTKVEGLRNLLDLFANQDLKAILLFSSTTARFGRTGQTAYAMANEVLNKTAQVEARRRPDTRVVAVNWGPWDGGMVTPALRRVFEAEGVGLIGLSDGGAFAVQELMAAGRAVEVIALGKPGRGSKAHLGLANGGGHSPTPPGGSAPHISLTQTGPPAAPPAELSLAFERAVDLATHQVLRSHVLDGWAVLPMALHLEWLAHAALHANPGLVFHGINDLRVTHGVKVEATTPAVLKGYAGKAVKADKLFIVPVELRGTRRDGQGTIHSKAEVVLASALPVAPPADAPPAVRPYPHPVEEVYRHFLFHGPALHGLASVTGHADTAVTGSAYPAPPPAEWFTSPLRPAWVADPLVLDASFQMMILWSFAQHEAGSLPCFASRYRQFRRSFPAGPVQVVIRVTRDNGSFARADIDYLDADDAVIARIQDYECVIDRKLDAAFRRNQLAAAPV